MARRPDNEAPLSASTLRQRPASRADHAARILLGQMDSWERFSAEDHAMLCALPAPHGALFVWLEQQIHENGAQPWGALREGLRDHPGEALALSLMASADMHSSATAQDATEDLRNLLTRMLIEQLKAQETAAIDASRTDPAALQRYRELQQRRRELEAAIPRQT